MRHIERDAIARLWQKGELVRWASQSVVDALAEAGGIARAEQVIEGVRRSASFQLPPTEGVVRFLRRLDQRVVRARTGLLARLSAMG